MHTIRHFIQTHSLLLFALFSSLIGSAQNYEAKLSGAQEALPVLTRATGSISAFLNGNQLVVTGSFSNLETEYDANVAGGAHLHIGLIGENGPVVFSLTPNLDANLKGGTFAALDNTFNLTNAQVEALENREVYANIHTTGQPGGELRGQLVPSGNEVYLVHLFGSNEVPSIITDAWGALLLDLDGTNLTVTGTFEGLEGDFDASIAGGAHLHNGLAGENGGVELLLNSEIDAGLRSGRFVADSNIFALSTSQLGLLEERSLYANLHTLAFPSGELRGNAAKNPDAILRAHLAGYNEIPVVTSSGHGEVLVELDGTTLTVSGAFDDLDAPFDATVAGGAHIHLAMAGRTGGVAQFLTATLNGTNMGGTFEATDNMFTLSNGAIDTLLQRGMYVNIHSTEHAAGEIRGQVVPTANYYFNGFMSGNFETPSALTSGEGFIIAEIVGDHLTVTGGFSNLSSAFDATVAGGSHLHTGLAGENGGIAVTLVPMLETGNMGGVFYADSNMTMIDSTLAEHLKMRAVYSNIHTTGAPAGELRAQLLHEATAYFVGSLSGGVERPVIHTAAHGGVAAELVGDELIFTGSFHDLSSAFDATVAGGSHLHKGYAGQTGDVFTLLNATVESGNMAGAYWPGDNQFMLTSGQIDTIKHRMAYVNIHTTGAPAGELRAQLMPLANSYITSNLMASHTMPVVQSDAMGGVIAERIQDQLIVSGAYDDLMSKVATDIVGGAHIHAGDAGSSGGVEFVLNTTFDVDTMGGVFDPMNNMFTMDSTQVMNAIYGNNYINIHSVMYQGGEIRGQLLVDDNRSPEMPMITSPTSGSVSIDSSSTMPFEAMWNMVTDPENNMVAYVWELATDSNFNQVLIAENVADMTTFSATQMMVDSVLEANGITYGMPVEVYHRVIATDGSMDAHSTTENITLVREMSNGINEKTQVSFSVYPNPAVDQITVQWESNEASAQTIELIDISGKALIREQVQTNSLNQSINVNTLSAGMYFLKMTYSNGNAMTSPLIIR